MSPSPRDIVEDFIDNKCEPGIKRGLGGKESVAKIKEVRLDLQQRDGDTEVYNLQVQLNGWALKRRPWFYMRVGKPPGHTSISQVIYPRADVPTDKVVEALAKSFKKSHGTELKPVYLSEDGSEIDPPHPAAADTKSKKKSKRN